MSNDTQHLNGTAVHEDAPENENAKMPPEDLNGHPQHETFGDESGEKSSGVRRIRAGRVVAAAAGVGLVGMLALGYGLTPPNRDDKPGAVKIDIRKQQGELPSPPALSSSADMNYATITQPPKAKPSSTAPVGYAALTADEHEPATTPGAPAEDEAVAEMRRQHAALRDELAAAQSQLAEQMEQTRQDMQAQQERQQAALDAPIGFDVKKPVVIAASPPDAHADDPTRPGIGSPLNPLVVAPSGDPAINPNEVQPESARANLQTEKIAFLNNAERGLDTYLRTGPTGPVAAQHELSAGTVIPGFTVTALNSDLPGKVVGRVSADVYDSATGRHVLIPQGSVAVGEYSSLVSNGQNRLLIAWEMLTFPDGRSVDLLRQPGTDASGASGLADRVDYHWDKLLLAGGLSTAVAIGGELAEGDNSGFGSTENVEEQLRELVFGRASDTASRVANKIIDRQLDVQPTITVRPGWKFRILLTRNLVLAPYVDSRR
jgi:type IV secretory pathway VirB10-like protein